MALVALLVAGLAALALLQRLLWPRLWADAAFVARAARCRRRALAAAGVGGGPGGSGGGGGSLAARFLRAARAAPSRPFLRVAAGPVPYGRAAAAVARVANALRGRALGGGAAGSWGPAWPWGCWRGTSPVSSGVGSGWRRWGPGPPSWARRCAPKRSGTACAPAGPGRCWWRTTCFPWWSRSCPALQEEDGIVVWVLGAGPYPPGVVALQELLDEASEELEPEDVWQPEDMNDTCLYIFTSGTTGLPKAARISHLKSIMCLSFYELVGASSRDVVYLALPLYHMAGSLLGIVGCIGIGATCVLKEKFSASQFWDDCLAEGVTVFQYIGELCRYLVNQPQRPGERQHRLRLAVGSRLRPDVWRRFLERFGAIRIVETYGLTEGNVTLFNYTGTPGAVGRSSFIYKLFSPFEIVRYDVAEGAPVRDKAGRCIRVGTGETGLLIAPVTPRTPFLGYAGSQELSEQKLLRGVFAEGDTYFSTGDLMEQDAAQFVRFRDRTGDTYRWKGENVATTEVAEVLAAHEALQEVTVYGVSVPGHEGRAGMAALVLRPGCRLDGAGLYQHVAELLPPYAQPRFLRLQERLEMTATFKQQKVRLAQEGFDPARVPDPLFLLDEAARAYVPLGPALWEDIVAGRRRL
nr:LOW QUALITY PROTEIN: solute carrier family 27 member 3 [Anas platyrhynchos]